MLAQNHVVHVAFTDRRSNAIWDALNRKRQECGCYEFDDDAKPACSNVKNDGTLELSSDPHKSLRRCNLFFCPFREEIRENLGLTSSEIYRYPETRY